MKEKYKSLTKNTILFAISSFGTKLLSFLLVPFYTNILSTSEYGTADILITTTALLVIVLTVNISEGVLIYAMDKKNNPADILSLGFRIIGYGTGLLALILALVYLTGQLNWKIEYYIFIFIYFKASVIYQTLAGYMRATDRVRNLAIAGIISSVVYLSSNIIFLLFVNWGLLGYLAATALGPMVAAVYVLISLRLSLKDLFTNSCSKELKSEIVRYCIPLVFNSLALWVNSFLDRYFVTALCGYEDNGIYSVASKIPIILSTCYTIFSQAWTISAVKEFDKEDKDGFFSQTYGMYSACMAIVCSGIIMFNRPIAYFIYSKDFYIAWKYSSVLLMATMFNSLTAFIGSIYSAVKQSKILATTTVISAIVNTVMNIALIPTYGIMGAAVATVMSMVVMWAIRIIKLKNIIILKNNWLKDVIAYCIMVLQIICEHYISGGWYLQIIFVLIIMLIYKERFINIIKTISGIIKSKLIKRGTQ